MEYRLKLTREALKDAKKLEQAGLKDRAIELLKILKKNPYQTPPQFKKLVGDLKGTYSRRINFQHRLVYEVLEEQKTVKIISMFGHYK